MDLWLRKSNSSVTREEFKNALLEIAQESEGVTFEELGEDSYEALFWGKEMCSVDFKETVDPAEDSGEYGQILLSTNSSLAPYAEFLAASLTKKLKTTIFDPQTMKDLGSEGFPLDLDGLKRKHQESFPNE